MNSKKEQAKVEELSGMERLAKDYASQLVPFQQSEIVEADVVSASSKKVILNVGDLITGIVPEKELSVMSAHLKKGDHIHAYVLDVEDKKGNMILSLRRADQERLSDDLKDKYQENKIIDVKVTEANKGGLLIDIGDYQGFLPVSQLAIRHYPKVDGGDPDKIYSRLKDLVDETLQVKIISFDPDQKKLIFSEKAAGDKDQEEKLSKIAEGQTIEGTITGLVDFGIFVKIGDGTSEIEGLVHISEIAWGRVGKINETYKVGDKVKVLIVSTDDNRVSLSIKRLQVDPWRKAAKKYKINDFVKGEITKITEYGLFVRIDSEIDGLVHLSEISNGDLEVVNNKYQIGKTYEFKIISFDPDAHRLGLSLKLEKDEKKEESNDSEKPTPKKKTSSKVSKKVVKEKFQEAPVEDKTKEKTEEVKVE